MSAKKIVSSDLLFDIFVNGFLFLLIITIVYPLYFVIIASFSDPDMVNSGQVILLPKGITFEGYKMIMEDDRIWIGYINTIMYTLGATMLGVFMTLTAGFALSRKEMYGRRLIMIFFIITMYFNGGLIPTYLVVKQLGLVNTRAAMFIIGSLSVLNVIITRTFFSTSIPEELYDAARIDGCNTAGYFFRIVMPLSKAIVAVMILYYAVGEWNSFFKALIYLNDPKYYPLQLILRSILVRSEQIQSNIEDIHSIGIQDRIADLVRFGVIIVSTIPVLAVYPFLQRYFVQGIMIGSVKG